MIYMNRLEEHKPRIMIAEDEIIIATQLKQRLQDLGYTVVAVATSGVDAIKMEGLHRPDVILMDIVMPGEIDGVQAARMIHSRRNVPVIFMTAHTDEAILRRAMKADPCGFISKPFRETDIRASIELASNKAQQMRIDGYGTRGYTCICSNCKKIRTDTGEWSSSTKHLPTNGDIRFTHSICPDCIRELYGDLLSDD